MFVVLLQHLFVPDFQTGWLLSSTGCFFFVGLSSFVDCVTCKSLGLTTRVAEKALGELILIKTTEKYVERIIEIYSSVLKDLPALLIVEFFKS